MKIKIKNIFLVETIDFLYGLSLKGKESRHRTRFINLLKEHLEVVTKEEQALIEEFAILDEEGKPVVDSDGNYTIGNGQEFLKQQNDFHNEEFIVDGENNLQMINTIKDIVLNYDEEVSGKKAELLYYLCESFEEGYEK